MKHLNLEEIIGFVSFDKLDDDSLRLVQVVNGHILNCDECRVKVSDFQLVYDELMRRNVDVDFAKTFIKESKAKSDYLCKEGYTI